MKRRGVGEGRRRKVGEGMIGEGKEKIE